MTDDLKITPAHGLIVAGDSITIPMPLYTWFDRLLWRLFRYQRRRPSVIGTYVITLVTNGDSFEISK